VRQGRSSEFRHMIDDPLPANNVDHFVNDDVDPTNDDVCHVKSDVTRYNITVACYNGTVRHYND